MVLVEDQFGTPLRAVLVKFTPSAGSSIGSTTALSDNRGIAYPGVWVLGATEGDYTLTASIEGLPPVVFRGTAHKGTLVDAYKLETVGGRPVPESLYGIIDGRLLFRDDGTLGLSYKMANMALDSTKTSAYYTKSGSEYMWDFGLLNAVTATLKDNRLYVYYQYESDFEDEVYVRLPR